MAPTVWAWGFNGHGQLGDGTQTPTTPVQVSGLTGVVKITAGAAHSIAVQRDGKVWAWRSEVLPFKQRQILQLIRQDGSSATRNPAPTV